MQDIVTERLIIRRFKIDDVHDLFEYLSDEQVVKFEPYEVFSKKQAIEETKKRTENDSFYAVCLRENNKLIGNLYLNQGDNNECELGYVFNRHYQGFGYATESASALISYAFSTLEARRIISMCNPLNSSSWKLLERLNMQKVDHLIKNIYFKRDENNEPIWVDTFIYAIAKEEWNNISLQHI